MRYDLDQELKHMKQDEVQELPEFIRSRLDLTYESLENPSTLQKKSTAKQYLRRSLITLATASAAVILIIGSGFISPVMAETLKNIPVVGSLFVKTGDRGLKAASEQGYTTDANASITHDGTTLSISELLYDGSRISMVMTRESSNNMSFQEWWREAYKHNRPTTVEFLADDKPLNVGWGMSFVDKNSAIITLSPKNLPDDFKLGAMIWDTVSEQMYEFNIPVKKKTLNNIVLTPELSKTHDNIHMNIEKLEITPATMKLEVSINGKPGQDIKEIADNIPDKYKVTGFLNIEYEVFNELGELTNMIDGRGSGSGNSFQHNMMYEPFPVIPQTVTIKPYVRKDRKKVYIPELEFILPVQK